MKAFAKITLNGSDVAGYNSVQAIGGEDVSDYVELSSFSIGVDRTVSSSGQLTGHPDYRRLTLSKRLDAASPMLLNALAQGQTTEVTVKLFGDSVTKGSMALEFALKVSEGRLAGVDWDGVSGSGYAEETIQIAYGRLLADNHAGSATSAEVTTASAT